jgi:hypothetical protein
MTHCFKGLRNAGRRRRTSARTISTYGDQIEVLQSICTGDSSANSQKSRSEEPCNARREAQYRHGEFFEVLEDEIGRYVCGAGGDSLGGG